MEELNHKNDASLCTQVPTSDFQNPGNNEYNPTFRPLFNQAGTVPDPPARVAFENREGDPIPSRIPPQIIDPGRYGITPGMIAVVVGAFVIYQLAKSGKRRAE